MKYCHSGLQATSFQLLIRPLTFMKTVNPAPPPHFLPSLAVRRGCNFLWKTHTFMIGKSFAICTLHFKHHSESTHVSKFSITYGLATPGCTAQRNQRALLGLATTQLQPGISASLIMKTKRETTSPEYSLKVLK